MSLQVHESDQLAAEIARQREDISKKKKEAQLGELEEVRCDLSRKHPEPEELANQRTTNSRPG
jgi:hypothetical protein